MSKQPLKTLKQQERTSRRQLILAAAQRLFAEKDFRGVTVREIAKTAGVSVGTIYNYYANLHELFLDVFLDHAETLAAQIDNQSGGKALGIQDFCRLYVGFLNDNMTFYQMMGHFMLGGELSPDATEKLNRMMRGLMDRIEAILRESGNGQNPRTSSHALFSALNGLMISYARYPGRTPAEIRRHTLHLADVIAEHFA
ncbi:MAG: TetR/AcrR family transcriptional regulator [Thermodesulfobacteriota bacterium]